ncbi:outer membrane lipoprotein Slp [Desulfarculus baarsii DSM 2075]|uniref:Outer membrane lipoprotein Slp n=1 Tax=Desulfarculus baarsii (strain ATCC 33931 / DSM 2075 / LMG 7858 / VKM B-1802 / 2st14) TaxID=644282 RepID=E1QH24_DESB2|nr:Slp family lipoprotein [Desulfarculus baarsii]ADK84867.1 outer membrane lipoprotein Slp [Desulfarculus baarsii DSM 2075]
MPRIFTTTLLLLAALGLSACGPTFLPQQIQAELSPDLSLDQVLAQPDAFKGKTVLWGGRVIKTINKPQGTVVEVVQLPLDQNGQPQDVDKSHGRFIVSLPQFLDPAIYAAGREVSVAGQVVGVEELPLGEIKYTYALLRGKVVHLWPKRPVNVRFDDPMPPLYPGPPAMYWYWSPYMWW